MGASINGVSFFREAGGGGGGGMYKMGKELDLRMNCHTQGVEKRY